MDADTFNVHPLHQNIQRLIDEGKTLPEGVQQAELFREIEQKTEYVLWNLQKSDFSLFSSRDLSLIDGTISQALTCLTNTKSDQSTSHLKAWDGQITEALKILPYPRMTKIFRSEIKEIIDEVRNEFDDFKRFTNEEIERIRKTVSDVSSISDELKTTLDEIKSTASQEQGKLSTQLTVWDKTIENMIAKKENEIAEKLNLIQSTFNDEIVEYSSRFETFLSENREKSASFVSENRATLDTITSDAVAWKENSVTKATEILDEIKNIYNMVGGTALAGDFISTANHERGNYTLYSRLAAVAFIVAPCVLFYLLFWHAQPGGFTWTDIVKRVPVAAIFLVPAFYFSGLAQRHRRIDIALRSLGIKMAALDAYLANFPTEMRNQLKADMASIFFNATVSSEAVGSASSKDLSAVVEQISKPLDKLFDLVQKFRPG